MWVQQRDEQYPPQQLRLSGTLADLISSVDLRVLLDSAGMISPANRAGNSFADMCQRSRSPRGAPVSPQAQL